MRVKCQRRAERFRSRRIRRWINVVEMLRRMHTAEPQALHPARAGIDTDPQRFDDIMIALVSQFAPLLRIQTRKEKGAHMRPLNHGLSRLKLLPAQRPTRLILRHPSLKKVFLFL